MLRMQQAIDMLDACVQAQQLCTPATRLQARANSMHSEARQAGADWATGTAQETLRRLPPSPAPAAASGNATAESATASVNTTDEVGAEGGSARLNALITSHSGHEASMCGEPDSEETSAQRERHGHSDRSLLDLVSGSMRTAGAVAGATTGGAADAQQSIRSMPAPLEAPDRAERSSSLSLTSVPSLRTAVSQGEQGPSVQGAGAASAVDSVAVAASPAQSDSYSTSSLSSDSSLHSVVHHGVPSAGGAAARVAGPLGEGRAHSPSSSGRCSSIDVRCWPDAPASSQPALVVIADQLSEWAHESCNPGATCGQACAGAAVVSEATLAELAELIISVCEEDALSESRNLGTAAAGAARAPRQQAAAADHRGGRQRQLRHEQMRAADLQPRGFVPAQAAPQALDEATEPELELELRAAIEASLAAAGPCVAELRERLRPPGAAVSNAGDQSAAGAAAGKVFVSVLNMSHCGEAQHCDAQAHMLGTSDNSARSSPYMQAPPAAAPRPAEPDRGSSPGSAGRISAVDAQSGGSQLQQSGPGECSQPVCGGDKTHQSQQAIVPPENICPALSDGPSSCSGGVRPAVVLPAAASD